MTYCIIARCANSGKFGIAIASHSMAAGSWCDGGLRSGTGVCVTLGFARPATNHLGMRLLMQGFTPEQALSQLLADDPNAAFRQIALLGREGPGIAHTGQRVRARAGHRTGEHHVACGDGLADERVPGIMEKAFEESRDQAFDERLLRALEQGRDACRSDGTPKERSAALIVFGSQVYSDTDLRVDLFDGAVAELRRQYEEYKPYEAYYVERGKNPRNAIPQREFADILKGKVQLKDVI